MRDPDLLLKYLPFFSIGGVLVCIFYVNGYFWYLGTHWLTSLSVGDYISLCLPVLPGLLLGVLAGMVSWEDLMWAKMDRELRQSERARRESENPAPLPPSTASKKNSRLAEYLAFPGVFLAFMAYSFANDHLPVEYVYWSMALAVFVSAALAAWFLVFSVFRDWVWGLAAIIAFAVMSVTNSVGQVQGAVALTRNPNTRMEFVDGRQSCVSILMLMERGPIFSADGRITELVNWANVRSLTRQSRCERASQPHA
jgi:hypothetical protein